MSKQKNLIEASQNITFDTSGNVTSSQSIVSEKDMSSGAGTAPIQVNSSATNVAGGHLRAAKLLHSGLTTAPQHVIIQAGKEDTAFNVAQFGFGYTGGGSTGNYATIGLHSKDEIIKATGTGAVQMQYQPAFLAGYNSNLFNTGIHSQQINYNYVMFDRTNSYSTSTGRYTVPVTGVYHFIHNVSARNSYTGDYEVKVFVNGVEKIRQFSHGGGYGHGGRAEVLLELTTNDYVEARGYWGTGMNLSGNLDIAGSPTQGVLSYFSGYLIG